MASTYATGVEVLVKVTILMLRKELQNDVASAVLCLKQTSSGFEGEHVATEAESSRAGKATANVASTNKRVAQEDIAELRVLLIVVMSIWSADE